MGSEVVVMALSTRPTRPRMRAGSDDGRRDLRRAWTSIALLLGSIVGGVWIMNRASWDLSFWASELVLVAGTTVVLLLAAAAFFFGRRAGTRGEPAGRVPGAIGLTIGGLSLLWALLPIAAHLAGFG
jgi:hypothetical protein